MRSRARAVVIGGGVGGCSTLYWLARLGWEDAVLVERAELTSGSTFHSAGLVGQLRSSLSLTKMIAALEGGTIARSAFGDQVVDHYLNYARTEQALYDKTVTDWERKRYFERG